MGELYTVDTRGRRNISDDAYNKAQNAAIDATIEKESELQRLRRNNEVELFNIRLEYDQKEVTEKAKRERAVAKAMIEQGRIASKADFDIKKKQASKEIDDYYKKLAARRGIDQKQLEKEQKAAEAAKHKQLEEQWKKDQKYKDKLEKDAKKVKDAEQKKDLEKLNQGIKNAWSQVASSSSINDFTKNVSNAFLDTKKQMSDSGVTGAKADLVAGIKAIAGVAGALDKQIDSIASIKSLVDTRLQGSGNSKRQGSYWAQMSTDITSVAGVSPFVKQSAVVDNLKSMISSGISFNVEQRAFLATIKDKIADTFDANDATLLRLIRIQEADSTASRLGMESAMTAFLNNMYENTEYLKGVAASVRQNIQEASALMTATDAVGFEYQVQKWMGSLYSVGFSKTSELSSALGKLAAGDISGLTGSGTGNLMIMAANQAGLSLGDVLAKGLDESSTNQLMEAMVNYLGGIYNESKDSRVVQQQMANVYGLAASDLKAAANILGDTSTISKNKLNYAGGIARLNQMAGTMYQRTSIGEMMNNSWDNVMYTMAAGIANNPALYATYKASNLLDAFGGINIPAIMAVGSGANLNATVADLMKVGAFSGGILESMGRMITSGSGGGISGRGMLSALGIGNNITTISRGSGDTGITMSNESTSSSTFVGNSDSSAVSNKALTDANDDANKQLAAKKEEQTEATTTMINDNVVSILELLRDVTTGALSFTTTENNFGLK